MAKEIYVKVEILTKKNEIKVEGLFMDKQMYEAILTLPIEEQRKYFADEYYEYEANRRYHRRFVSLDTEDDDGKIHDIPDTSPTPTEKLMEDAWKDEIAEAIKQLTPRQQEMVKLIYFEGKSQVEVANIYGVTEQAISQAMTRIHNSLKKILKKS